VVVEGSYFAHHQEQLYIEPQGVIAWWDDEGAHATGSIQCPFYVHKAFHKAFELPTDRIHIAQAVTGGGFGGKEEYPSVIALHAALLAKKSGRPVRMIYDRTEDIEATTKRHPCLSEIKTGCDRDGKLRALSIRILMDGGAYATLTPVVLSRGALHAAGAYRWEDVRIEAIAVATNTPPNGAFRGFGAPQTIWAIERHLDAVARRLGRDPLELKAQNVLCLGDSTATGQVLRSSVAGAECVDKALEASDYRRKRALGPVVKGRKARGIGAAVFMHGAGFTGSGERYLKGKVAVDLGPRGRLRIRTASTDIGQGTETVFRQIAADAAEVPIEMVDFAVPCTTTVPDSGPTVASRTVMVVGSIVEAAARDIAERVRREQAERGGLFADAADRLLDREREITSLRQYSPPEGVVWDDATYKGDAYPCFGWACDIAEVEVDLDTFEVRVLDFWSATDVGKAINPVMCKGQIEGGSLQAIGWALSEEVTWREGRITNPRMTNYIIPTTLDAPRFSTILVEAPFAPGPGGGAKGIGELPMDGGAPAIAAAIEHATGIALAALPLTPERLFAALLSGLGRSGDAAEGSGA
jgi:CO/xanthine dehydrogenase Mo-binding subunit